MIDERLPIPKVGEEFKDFRLRCLHEIRTRILLATLPTEKDKPADRYQNEQLFSLAEQNERLTKRYTGLRQTLEAQAEFWKCREQGRHP